MVDIWLGDKQRKLTTYELAIGKGVFQDTIKWGQVRISNGHGDGHSIFTNAGIGQDTIHVTKSWYHPTNSIPEHILVHELVHVWQATNHGFTGWGYKLNSMMHQGYHIARGNGRNAAYTYDRALLGKDGWHDFSVEEQAQIIEDWYMKYRPNISSPPARKDPAFRYVHWVLRKEIFGTTLLGHTAPPVVR